MDSEESLRAAGKLSPPEGSGQVALPRGEILKNQDANVLDQGTRIEQAETRTEQAEARTEQAKTRTEQAETRTEQAEARTEQAKTRTEQAEARTEQAETRSEQAIRESELNYRRLFEAARDGILILDADTGHITDVNPFLIEMLGFSHAELIGMPMWDLGPFKDIVENKAKFDQQRQGYVRYENQLLETRDGRKIAVEFVSNVYQAGDRNMIQCNIRDISERQQAEATLQKERNFISRVVDTVGSLVVVIDRQGCIIRFNRACEQLTGYAFDEVKGRNLLDMLLAPDEAMAAKAVFNNICLGQFPCAYENDWVTKEGRSRLIAWSNTALVDKNGEVEYVIGTGTDITERKKAEEQIAEQAAFLDKARDAIFVRDMEGTIRFWNKGAERIYGWTSQEIVGRNIGEVFYTNPKKFEELNRLTISQGEWHGELQHLTRDRGEITVEARSTLIRDDDGRPKAVLGINTDITERKKIEAQFMRAQRMESIGTLAGGIAHDLNNILAPIMMSIDILKGTSDDPLTKKILETIEVSAKRGADIVRQVLSFARGVEGERVEVQPTNLLKDLENIIKGTFPKNIRLQFSVPNDAWRILGDPTQVHQILLNLCVNARDAMPEGGNLTVGVENCVLDEQYAAMNIQAKPGHYVNISVTDSGTGIPQNIRDKIFEPFFTTKEFGKGTGLGLSSVMAIVKNHEGTINVYSEPGKGTTFKIYLPAMEISSEAQMKLTQQISLARGNGETVLVVDDEASILIITSQTLQTFGYRVLTATDGAEALAIYAEHKDKIAVVLTDMTMPVMDGPAMIDALMQIDPAIKIIAASGFNATGGVAKVAAAGVKNFLTKPYTTGTLLKTLRAILDEP